MNVLLVDDDKPVLHIHGMMLEAFGHVALKFLQPEDAISYLGKNPNKVDCIITDFQMPVMNGLELIQKAIQIGLKTPFFIFTGLPNDIKVNQELLGKIIVQYKPVPMSFFKNL